MIFAWQYQNSIRENKSSAKTIKNLIFFSFINKKLQTKNACTPIQTHRMQYYQKQVYKKGSEQKQKCFVNSYEKPLESTIFFICLFILLLLKKRHLYTSEFRNNRHAR